jgi:hypothetical protein
MMAISSSQLTGEGGISLPCSSRRYQGFEADLHVDVGLVREAWCSQGLPAFVILWITSADVIPILIGGCAVAVVSFADTSVLSRAYAALLGAKVEPNQEMVGLGAANLAAGAAASERKGLWRILQYRNCTTMNVLERAELRAF